VAVDFLCDFMTRRKAAPFFAYYCPKLVHVPQAPSPDHDPEIVKLYKEAFNRVMSVGMEAVKGEGDPFPTQAAPWIRSEITRRGLNPQSDKQFREDAMRYLDKMAS